MDADKMIQPIFIDSKKDDGSWTKEKADILRKCGYEIIFIPDAQSALFYLPAAPLMVPSDAVTRALYKAVRSSDTSMKAFGKFYLDEVAKVLK